MLPLIQNKYYIIRYGDFATNGNTKLGYGLFTLMLCMYEYIINNSLDCFIILIGSTTIWSFVELFLHISKTRVIKPMYINYNNTSYELHFSSGVILQGLQEGGVLTTLGLFFGDHINERSYFLFLNIFLIHIMGKVCSRNIKNRASERQVNTPTSLLFIGSIIIYDIITLYQYPEHIQRQLNMFYVLIYISLIWTSITWYKGFRGVKIYIKNPKYNIERISNTETTIQEFFNKDITMLDTFLILGYDIIFEIGFAYILFYNLFLI